jgi:hypothetical protein
LLSFGESNLLPLGVHPWPDLDGQTDAVQRSFALLNRGTSIQSLEPDTRKI